MPLLHRVRDALTRRTRRARVALLAGVLALAAVAVLVPLALAEDGGGEDAPCVQAPEFARALARDPERATKALDPGTGVVRLASLRRMLRVKGPPLCEGPSGTRVAGRALLAATTDVPASATERRKAAARVVHAAVLVLGERPTTGPDFPVALAPYVARMLAEYIGDVRRDAAYGGARDWEHPTVTDEEATYPEGGNWATPFPHGDDIHVSFGRTSSDPGPQLERVVRRLALSPRAFATLYDADRAYFAYYLERLTAQGREPGTSLKGGTMGTELEVTGSSSFVSLLMRGRTKGVLDGDIDDLAAYDRAVLRHTRGVYRAADHRVATRPRAATVARRTPDAGPGTGKRATERLLDGRVQLLATFDRWARDRDIPEGTVERLRAEIESQYTASADWTS